MTTGLKTDSLTTLSRKGICLEFFSAYQDLEIDRMINLCNPQGDVWFKPLGDGGKGKIGELGRTLWLVLMDCFPDLDNTVNATAAEEHSIVCEVTIFGIQQKDFFDIPSKGLRFDSDHIFIFHFNPEDKIEAITIDWDHLNFKRQLGS